MSGNAKHGKDWVSEAAKAGYKVEVLAERLGMSSVHLRRIIRGRFDVRAQDYLEALQLNEALNNFADGDDIKTASSKACYKTVQHFGRVFKKHLKSTPSEYIRKKYQQCSV